MPFKSEAQRRWMHANKPEMADKWEDHTPDDKDLPEKVGRLRVTSEEPTIPEAPLDIREALKGLRKKWMVESMQAKTAKRKPYRNRVDVIALNPQGKLLSGLYPDGSIGLFGGGVDRGETVVQAAKREFLEEAGRKVTNARRLDIPNYEESQLARKGWRDAGKHERVKRYGGTRSFTVLADLVKGKKLQLSEPADHITSVKLRTLDEAIKLQKKALEDAEKGRKGILKHRLKALKRVQSLREKVAADIAAQVWEKIAAEEIPTATAPTVIGGLLGGTAAHSLFPAAEAQRYRDLAAVIPKEQVAESLAQSAKGPVDSRLISTLKDVSRSGKNVKFRAPAFVRQRYLLDRALQANAPRLLKGIGLGLLGGYGMHKLTEDPNESPYG